MPDKRPEQQATTTRTKDTRKKAKPGSAALHVTASMGTLDDAKLKRLYSVVLHCRMLSERARGLRGRRGPRRLFTRPRSNLCRKPRASGGGGLHRLIAPRSDLPLRGKDAIAGNLPGAARQKAGGRLRSVFARGRHAHAAS